MPVGGILGDLGLISPTGKNTASKNQPSNKQDNQWMNEIRSFYTQGRSWKEAMILASNARKQKGGGGKLPNKSLLTVEQATNILREYYRSKLNSGAYRQQKVRQQK